MKCAVTNHSFHLHISFSFALLHLNFLIDFFRSFFHSISFHSETFLNDLEMEFESFRFYQQENFSQDVTFSWLIIFSVLGRPKSTPSKPTVKETTNNSITVQWTPVVDSGDILYNVEVKESKSKRAWTLVNKQPIGETEVTAANLKAGSIYEFRVFAVNAAGSGPPSEPSDAIECIERKGPFLNLQLCSHLSIRHPLHWLLSGDERLKARVRFSE